MNISKISDLFTKAAHTHHAVWLIQNGEDPDWPIWYAEWLIDHTDLLDILEVDLTISELVCFLVGVDVEYGDLKDPKLSWEKYYAEQLVELLSEEVN